VDVLGGYKVKKNKEKKFTRYSFLIGIVIAVLSYITLKLVDLQIIKSDYYKEYANSKSHKLIEETAPRGRILDSNGVELATNKPSYVLSFTATDESSKQFYSTMYKVFKILDSKNQTINDEFPLKLNPFRFEFDAVDDSGKKTLEFIFKNNIGLNDEIAKKKFKKNYKDIDSEKQKIVKEEEMKYTPKETFEYLLRKYNVPSSKGIGGVSGAINQSNNKTDSFYTLDEQRKFIVLKYAVEMKSYSGYKTVVISNIDKETAFYFSERLNDLPGIFVDTQSQRCYPNGELGSAFLGYISKISDEKYKEQGYDLSTDFVGVSGIEQSIEDRLRGAKGAKVVQVNGKGRVINELAKRDASPGQDVHLTIDKDVQEAGEKALDERFQYLQKKKISGTHNVVTNANRGAVVAINVKTGGIIALVSRPGFDPNAFAAPSGLTSDIYNKYYNVDYEEIGKSKGWSKEKIDKIFPKNKNGVREDVYDFVPKPLYNYATSSLIPPGSTFKPLTAVAGLSEGVINKDTSIYDPGWFEMAPGEKTRFPEDKGNYNANLALAIQYSSNPYFMTVAKRLMEKYEQPGALEKGNLRHKFDAIAKYAWQFGLGADPEDKDASLSTGIEINENFLV
jgi:penicillin-binding protein 2